METATYWLWHCVKRVRILVLSLWLLFHMNSFLLLY